MKLPDVHPFLWSLLRRQPQGALDAPEQDDPAWQNLVSEGLRQNLLPLLYPWCLSREGRRQIPEDQRRLLASEAARTAAGNLVLEEELRAILIRTRDSGLGCVPLRGLALSEHLYGAGALRPTGDIDHLVRREDLPAISEILGDLGYASMEHRPGFAESFSYTLEFIKDRHGWIVVEPHWTLAYPPFTGSFDMEQVWTRCRKGRVVGVDTWLLADEDLLAHLCFHILHQGNQSPLLWWYELDLLIRQSQASLNWETVTLVADRSGQSRIVHEVLGTLADQFHTPVPRAVLSRLGTSSASAPSASLLVDAPDLIGREEFAQMLALPGCRTKLRYGLGLLCPAPDYMIQRYGVCGRTRLGVAYIGRLVQLFREGLRWTGAFLTAAFSAKATLSR